MDGAYGNDLLQAVLWLGGIAVALIGTGIGIGYWIWG